MNSSTQNTTTPRRGVLAFARHTWTPWLLVPALVWTLLGIATTHPLGDVDSYWHVLIGYDIVDHHRFGGDPNWVYGPHHDWVSTQWLSEVLFAGLHALFGWAGLTYFTIACGAALLVLLTRLIRDTTTGPISATPIAWIVYALVGFSVAVTLQERPVSLSLVLLTVLSGWTWRGLTRGEWPRWWTAALFTWVWAQFHGYWVMVAAAITLAALLRALDQRTTAGWQRPFIVAAACTVVGIATPAGLFSLYAPIVFKDAAGPFLTEWAPTNLTGDHSALAGFVLVGLVGVAWARTTTKIAVGTVLWVSLWVLFATTAFRNVVPAMLLITPAAVAALTTAWPNFGTRMHGTFLTKTVVAAVAVLGIAVSVTRLSMGSPLPSDTPTRAYDAISDAPGERRVLNFFDLGGQTMVFTRPGVRVAVDGRSDMYGADILGPYFVMLKAGEGWQETFASYNPTDVLLKRTSPLNAAMEDHGWKIKVEDGPYVLWVKQ